MTRQEMLLTIAAEECAEVAQRITKALRFGLLEVQPGQDRDNTQRIEGELVDLLTTLDMAGVINIQNGGSYYAGVVAVALRRARVEKYLAYSAECGTLAPVGETPARKWTGPGELERTGYTPGETPAPCTNCAGEGASEENGECWLCKGTGVAGETPEGK